MSTLPSDYSKTVPKILEPEDRLRIAKQIISVIKSHVGETESLTCLDIGCSSGVISNILSNSFKKVVAFDIDSQAIEEAKNTYKKNNLVFQVMSAQDIKHTDNSFDIVVCNQVYNSTPNPKKLISEIERVLKPGGVCFFAGRNKYALIERQYDLPFLSWLPRNMAVSYIKIMGKGDNYFGNYYTYSQLRQLVNKFILYDYTIKILKDPKKYGFKKLATIGIFFKYLPNALAYRLLPIIPNYIWILQKRYEK